MKFKDYTYERPDFEKLAERIDELTSAIQDESDIERIQEAIHEINEIKNKVSTMENLAYIRNSINTQDKFYEDEIAAINEKGTVLISSLNRLSKVLVHHSLRSKLEKRYGSHWFQLMVLDLKTFDDSIAPLLVEESRLTVEYDKIMASAQIEFDGKVNNLSQVRKYLSSTDREIRKEAMLKINAFFAENEERIDSIYDKLVHIRTEMAQKLGYKDYIEYRYAQMGRTDYNRDDVANYRKQVLDYLVPVAEDIFKKNLKRIHIEDGKFYDLGLEFLDGNPTPKGNKDELVAKAMKMYKEMSAETDEFFTFMTEHELLDLETKPGKANGGYCTYIPEYKSPFIFSNFNGTRGDVDVLTHEAGHAFMAYSCKDTAENPDLCWPTSEACEIHSMSMEFFAYPWMKLFFEDDENKYKVSHMNGALTFIPYGVCVDHFQHLVYEKPEASPQERKNMWKQCERLYTPWRDMEGMPMYEKGAFWFNQPHIFSSPFYYIDYTLAQVCALEFYLDSLQNRKDAWERYVHLCRLGGSKSFLELIQEVGIHNPFADGSIKSIVERLLPVIEQIKL